MATAAPTAAPAAPSPPRPVRLDVTSSGKGGKYAFDVQVISDQGRGIKAQIRIIEGVRAQPLKDTNEQGFLEHPANAFTDEEQEFLFSVIGTDLQYEVTLDGPENEPKPEARKKIKPIAGAGFWANVLNVINHK